ncbi:MAG: glycoside hydrolase family 2 TIM barrel-domain containing protein [Eubacteriales bacterium]|nr:glycoside hydrolase family 2 TIM barrel-domain containing protein [Eubacteriales bacterium]
MNSKECQNLAWLDDPAVFRVGKLPPHSDHAWFADAREASGGRSSLAFSLNGTWQFCYSENPHARPADFYREDFDAGQFGALSVPGHIELAGYGHVHYLNKMYPWESRQFRRPAHVLSEKPHGCGSFADTPYNPVGSYRRTFDLPPAMAGLRVRLRFDGAEQAFFVWLNGHFIGYSEDSYTPAEFDLTPFLRSRENLLCVEIYKWSTAAFAEDQDYFRFFGIFRDVTLLALPAAHIEDLDLRPELHPDLTSGSLSVRLKSSGSLSGCAVKVTLYDETRQPIAEKTCALASETLVVFPELHGLKPWSHFSPSLYKLSAEIIGGDGNTLEYAVSSLGFRRIEISGKTVLLNGKRLRICGVNRHEWNGRTGRCLTFEDQLQDIAIFKRNHINAVRTSHYPNQSEWYRLCDQNGIYVMAETNLESHGSWQKLGETEPSWNIPGNSPIWETVVLDRAQNQYELLKNHPSILFWSLGNEAYAGTALAAMNRYYKEKNDGRLTHYEGVTRNRKYENEISDLESRMYASPAAAAKYLSEDPAKPFILCEYLHSMGNSTGGLKEYMELFDLSDAFVGGFIWDYIDKALIVPDNLTGQDCIRYGGDFDDRPSDYAYSADGLVFADRTEKPAMQEVRYFYERYET